MVFSFLSMQIFFDFHASEQERLGNGWGMKFKTKHLIKA